ncbi:hypothetical protein EBZ37_11685, partial [bacterium]|nr:hypothetical protein [bacterium]
SQLQITPSGCGWWLQEIPVPGSMARCLRILLHVNTELSPRDIEHVYLRDAQRLRPPSQLHLRTGS